MPENFSNRYTTTLAAGVTSGALTGTVTTATGAPAVPFRAIISAEGANTDEIVLVTGRTGTTLTWTRAAEAIAGVQAASAHVSGATITAIVTAASMANATPWFNIRSYGATGGADDTAAMDLAVVALTAAGGGVLYIPAGTYKRTTNLALPSNSVLMGSGSSSVLYFTDAGAAGNIGVFLSSVTNVTIRDLRITSNGTSRTGVYGLIRGVLSDHVTIRDCTIDTSPAVGIQTTRCDDWLISGNRISGTFADGINVTRQSSHIRIVGNDITLTGDDAISINSNLRDTDSPPGGNTYTACTQVIVEGNHVHEINTASGLGSGIKVLGGISMIVRANTITTVHAHGIVVDLSGSDPIYVGGSDGSIVGNVIKTTGLKGINIAGMNGGVVADNIVRSPNGLGIALIITSLHCVVTGNMVRGSVTDSGLYEEAGSGPNVFVGNDCQGNQAPNKLINGGTGSVDTGNLA